MSFQLHTPDPLKRGKPNTPMPSRRKQFAPQPEGILTLQNMPDGTWMAEWVNTVDATNIKKELVTSRKGNMELKSPATEKSIAVYLFKVEKNISSGITD